MSLYMRYLHQEGNVSCQEIKRRYPQYALRSIYRHARKNIPIAMPVDGRKKNKGRPRKVTVRDERNLLRTIDRLRSFETNTFTIKRLRLEAGLEHVSTRTVNRFLNKHQYKYRQLRKKGLLTKVDKVKRLKFAKKVNRLLSDSFWRDGISFYFDGVSFAHKTNPCDEARASASMAWRRGKEGLDLTAKGKKEGNGGRVAHFFVAIAYGQGVILCEHYKDTLTGELFAEFIKNHFPQTFERSANPRGKLFLQDGDPRQNSVIAKRAMYEIGCKMFAIPARSPDLNPIENMFHLVRKQLHHDALVNEITKESFSEFAKRVKATMTVFDANIIDRTIESMNGRIARVVKSKGARTKY